MCRYKRQYTILLLLCSCTVFKSCLAAPYVSADPPIDSIDDRNNITSSLVLHAEDAISNLTAYAEPQCRTIHNVDVSVVSCEDVINRIPDISSALLSWNGEKLQVPARFSSCK